MFSGGVRPFLDPNQRAGCEAERNKANCSMATDSPIEAAGFSRPKYGPAERGGEDSTSPLSFLQTRISRLGVPDSDRLTLSCKSIRYLFGPG